MTASTFVHKLPRWIFPAALLLFVFLTRLPLVIGNTIPFSFDHGKDAMAIMHLIKGPNLKFVGPWTSIPGLYFGPGWYYLLAPSYILSGGNPTGAVIFMVLMNALFVLLAYRYFGKLVALFFATATYWTIISTSAWNPFPMPWLSLVILIALQKMKPKSVISSWLLVVIGLCVSLSFHFSSACAFFYLVSIPLVLLYKVRSQKIVISIKSIVIGIMAFLIPFFPQGLFELRHDFSEVQAVISYLSDPPANQIKTSFTDVVKSYIGEAKLTIIPEIEFNALANHWFFVLSVSLLLLGIFLTLWKGKKVSLVPEIIVLTIIPLLGFSRLHFNIWYVGALMPFVVVIVAQVLRSLPKPLLGIYVLLLIMNPIAHLYQFETVDKTRDLHGDQYLPAKIEAVDTVYALADGKPFSSYQYSSTIYDYTYQYIYLWKGYQGKTLPLEFSYKPKEIDYVPEKRDLLKDFPVQEGKPTYVFYIVEGKPKEDDLKSWIRQQYQLHIVKTVDVGDGITIYQGVLNTE